MSIPPPGLGGGVARTGPPPGFGSSGINNHAVSPGGTGGANPSITSAGGQGQGATTIVRAQIAFLLSTLTEDSFDKSAAEIRTLASTNGPDMYHHFLRRAAVTAGPILQTLIQHSQQYKDDPAAPPPNIQTAGQAALAWRLLVTEAVRAARDVTLAPHFSLIMLSPSSASNGTPLPLPSLRFFNLSSALLFSLAAYTLASPHVFPPTHASNEIFHAILRQTFQPAMELLRAGMPFWSINTIPGQLPSNEDLTLQEARTLILALFPRSISSSGSTSRPATPTNPTSPHHSPLSSVQRGILISSLTVKFSSPAIILQTLSALSPGGPPRSQGAIPLEDILFELGETLTQDEGTVEAVIGRWWGPWLLEGLSGEEKERAVTDEATRTVIGLCEGLREGRGVDLHGVVKGLCSVESISFADLIRSLDMPASPATYPTSLPLLISLILIPNQVPTPPIAGLLPASPSASVWSSLPSLLDILGKLTTLPPDALPIFTMPSAPPPSVLARIIDLPDASMSKVVRQQAKDVQAACIWNTLGLIQVMVAACVKADEHGGNVDERAEIGRRATEILDKAAALAPELVLIGMEKLPKPLPSPVETMRHRLLNLYLSSPTNAVTSSQLVFQQMWSLNPNGLLSALTEFYNEDESNIGRVVEIAWDLKILDKLLTSDNLHLALDVAALASNKEYLNMEKWLADAVAVRGDEFLQAMFDFVEHKIRLEIDHQHQPESIPPLPFTLGTNVYSIFIRVVRNADNLSQEDIFRFKNLRTDILILQPRLLNLRPGSKEEQGFTVVTFSKEITSQVDRMYQQMYSDELKLDDVVNELKRCQKSDDPKDHDVFACALHSLFDEYKFVKAYPPKELTMTGILFGAIIDYRLVKDTPAFVATRYVLDACKTAPHEALYQFGINALSVLRASLVDFPGLCRSLLEIPALHESHPVLINDIHAALAERDDLDQQGGVKLAFPALKLPVLIEEGDDEFKVPEDKKKDAIMFIINNIAPSNYEAKSAELIKAFEDQYSRWFAHYFIEMRVSLELNRHDIYMQLLEAVGSSTLERHVLWETYRKARDLLNAEATASSASERTTLKTVATWLGRLTLARNLPIRMKELSVKDLLIQGYDNKRLIVAIPFVCNLVVACKDSSVFHPPNPWMMAILRLLAEFYHFADIRLNLKFEIEVLFSKLNVELDTIEPSELLRKHVPPAPPQPELPNRLDLELQRATASGNFVSDPPMSEEFARMQQMQTEQAAQAAQDAFLRRVDELVSQLPEFLVFSSDYPIFTAPTLKRVVHHSIDRAIREIITPVVERSVTIAGISSRDLVQKDFGMEPDPLKMRHAAHMMVQNLAGNLAMVTCKEPLRTSMMANVRAMLMQNGFTEETMPEAMISGVVGDNLDAACVVIKKAAMEKSAKDIDVNLAPQYAARKAHRQSANQQPFWDGASFAVSISHAALPEHLRLRNGGLSPLQLRVYDDFSEPSRVMSQAPSGIQQITNGENYLPAGYRDLGLNDGLVPPDIKRGPSPREGSYEMQPDLASPQPLPAQTSVERFHELVAEIERHLAQSQIGSLSALSVDHELRGLIRAVILVTNQAINREQIALLISQKVVQLLYKCSSQLGREVYALILQQLCDLVPKVNKEVKQWLIYAEDSRKFNVPVTVTLIRASFISAPELDAQLADLIMRSFPSEVLDFAAQLVRECALGERPCVPRNGFAASLAAMLKAHEVGRATPAVDALLDDLRGPRTSRELSASSNGPSEDSVKGIDGKLQERLTHYFLEWVRVFQSNKNPEVAFVPYVTFLQKEGILGGEDVSAAFYRSAINCAVDLDASSASADGSPMRFHGTDSLAKLIVLIVKNYGDKSGASNVPRTVYYYNKIITIMSYSLVQRQLEMGESFDQRPWARFFTSMLSELAGIEISLPETYIGCLKIFANVLGIVQPTYAPRFAFGWLSLIAHRLFMPKLLSTDEGWSDFHRCMMWLLRFLSPFLKSGEMSPSSRSIFRGTIRILLVLMHDFPEFLVEFYHTLSTAIPTHCVQLRNIVLSAFPHSEAPLPDYYKRLDQLIPEMQRFPTIRSDNIKTLNSGNMRAAIESHVRTGVPAVSAIVGELKNRIAVKSYTTDGPVVTWNHTLLHATVFYLGTTAVARRAAQTGLAEFDPKAPEVGILTNLAFAFDAEGQYFLLSVVADQLRYPSAHTLFFISFMLYLFGLSARSDPTSPPNAIPERIGRVLLERVIVQRPHPWGLIVAFIELLDNAAYGFWKQPFVRAEEEIFLLFGKAQENFVGMQ